MGDERTIGQELSSNFPTCSRYDDECRSHRLIGTRLQIPSKEVDEDDSDFSICSDTFQQWESRTLMQGYDADVDSKEINDTILSNKKATPATMETGTTSVKAPSAYTDNFFGCRNYKSSSHFQLLDTIKPLESIRRGEPIVNPKKHETYTNPVPNIKQSSSIHFFPEVHTTPSTPDVLDNLSIDYYEKDLSDMSSISDTESIVSNSSGQKKIIHEDNNRVKITLPNEKQLHEKIPITIKSNNNSSATTTGRNQLHNFQVETWLEKYRDLCLYVRKHGHCNVPRSYKQNPSLGQWVKRQRYEYKLMMENKASPMTNERIKALDQIGFVWESQSSQWMERLNQLRDFRKHFGHCNVPSRYPDNKKLAVWVKIQRRQYKLRRDGKKSNITIDRIKQLDDLNFTWEIRNW